MKHYNCQRVSGKDIIQILHASNITILIASLLNIHVLINSLVLTPPIESNIFIHSLSYEKHNDADSRNSSSISHCVSSITTHSINYIRIGTQENNNNDKTIQNHDGVKSNDDCNNCDGESMKPAIVMIMITVINMKMMTIINIIIMMMMTMKIKTMINMITITKMNT